MTLKPLRGFVSLSFCLGAFSTQLAANPEIDFHGEIQVDQRNFLQTEKTELEGAVNRIQNSLMLETEWLWQNDGHIINFKPFFRIDSHDSERTHADIRELQWLHYWQDYEISVGIGRVFWGVTESTHLVDVMNQTDAVEGLDGEDKLGQPMLRFKMVKDWGTLDSYILPYFRERTFAGRDSRLSLPFDVDDNARYESSRREHHLDYALRYSNSVETWDFALSYFNGTNRDPEFIPQQNSVVPFYAQMQQIGLELQNVSGDWLWKLEARYRDSIRNEFASTTGVEYTQVGVFDTVYDLGWIAEYSYDNHDVALNQNDMFIGWRLALNDANGSEILFGISQDLGKSEQAIKLEASGRLEERWKWQIEGWAFSTNNDESPLYTLKSDDFIACSISYFF